MRSDLQMNPSPINGAPAACNFSWQQSADEHPSSPAVALEAIFRLSLVAHHSENRLFQLF